MKTYATLTANLRSKAELFESMPAFLIALGCARAWTSLVFADSTFDTLPYESLHTFFDAAYCAISILIALAARKLLPLFGQPWTKPAALACMLASSALWIVQPSSGIESYPLAIAGSLLGGAGFALFLLLWSETLCGMSIVKIVLYTCAGMFAGSSIAFFAAGMDPLRLSVLVAALPIAAMFALMRANSRVPEASRQQNSCPKFRHPWKIYLVFGVWTFAYGLRVDQLSGGAGMHSSASTALVSLGMFAFVLLFSDRFGLSSLFRSPVLLMVSGFLLVPAESFLGPQASSWMISMGFTLMSTLVALMLYDMSKRLGVAVIALAGVKNAEQAFATLGSWTSGALHSSLDATAANTVMSSATIFLIIVVSILLFSERDFKGKWGITLLDDRGLVKDAVQNDALYAVCGMLSDRYALSPREGEILRLIAEGKTGREIAEELYIAEGTCKAHTRHIYEKIGIHSRKELFAIVKAAQES